MENDKICVILRSFSKEELKSFEKFIISPYFPHRRDVSGYFSELKEHHPDFEITHKDFFGKLFPGEEFNDRKLKNLGAELVKLAEQFLAHDYLNSNEADSGRFLAIQLKNKKLDKLFFKVHDELKDNVEKKLFNSFDCYNETEELEKLLAGHYVENNQFDEYAKVRSEFVGHFTTSFIVRYLKSFTDNIVLRLGYGKSIDNPVFNLFMECIDFEKLLELIENTDYGDAWLVKIYYYGYLAHNDLTENKYYELYKSEFYKNVNKFSRLEKHFLFSSLTDLHLMKRKYVKTMSQREIFEIHKRMLAEEAYSISPEIPMDLVLFRNILLLSLELKELDWTEQYINTYTEMLMPIYQLSTSCFAKAWLHFEKGEPELALSLINKINYDFFMYKRDVKLLLMGIYYELNLFDQAYSLIDAYRHFVAETSGSRKEVHLRDVKFYSQLLKAKVTGDNSDIGFMVEELKKGSKHIFMTWIIKSGEELIKKRAK